MQRHIALVEDEPAIRQNYAEALQTTGSFFWRGGRAR